jgi:uncharacterized membrane protein YfcA
MEILGYILAALVGMSLALIGSGGSILTVPILVYVMGVNPVLSTAYSLFIVGSTALAGGVQCALQRTVNFKIFLIFGIPSIIAVYVTRLWLMPLIPAVVFESGSLVLTKDIAIMIFFSLFMLLASYSMIRNGKNVQLDTEGIKKINYPIVLTEGLIVGVITGIVGAGGGFLIIPALVLFAKIPMKLAVGTSLFIIAAKSLIGFIGDLQSDQFIDWPLLLAFTFSAIVGIFIGNYFSRFVTGKKLQKSFGWFILIMGTYIIFRELFL